MAPRGLLQGLRRSLIASLGSWDSLGAPDPPASPVGISNPHGRQRRPGLAVRAERPSSSHPSPDSGSGVGAWLGGPICFQSGPLPALSSGLWLGWGPRPRCPHPSPRPQPDSQREGSLFAPASPHPGVEGWAWGWRWCVCVGGAASATQPRLGGALAAPRPTSFIWVCLGSPLLLNRASSPSSVAMATISTWREGGAGWGSLLYRDSWRGGPVLCSSKSP